MMLKQRYLCSLKNYCAITPIVNFYQASFNISMQHAISIISDLKLRNHLAMH